MNSEKCKRFDSCNAPICPLDENYTNHTFLRGEPVCFLMNEGVKKDGIVKIRGSMGVTIAQQVQSCIDWVQSSHRPPNFGKLAMKLHQATTTKSRLANPANFC